jgi:hypothetical protein
MSPAHSGTLLATPANMDFEQVAPAAVQPPPVAEGPASDTVVQEPNSPVSFRLPAGWSVANVNHWGDHQTTIRFRQTTEGLGYSLYYQFPANPPVGGDPSAELDTAIPNQVHERQTEEGVADYRVRPESVRKLEIGGLPAISFLADYRKNEAPYQEYLLRVIGKSCRAQFFFSLPAGLDVEYAIRRLEPIAATLRIP